MKTRAGGLLAIVLLASSVLFASSISDPGLKLGPGVPTTYDTYAVIVSLPDGGFQLLFDGHPFAFTNPFTAPFCSSPPIGGGTGISCFFENDSNGPITTLTQAFITAFDPGQLTCLNAFPESACTVGGDSNNVVGFTGFSVPTESDWVIGGDSGFNLSYLPSFTIPPDGGFTQSTAGIATTFINGKLVVPEPASLGLMLSGLFGLGLAWRRKTRVKRP